MLGFGPYGQFALGELPRVTVPGLPGSGAAHRRFNYVPEPPYEVKPNKPFRPVWDKVAQKAPVVAAPARPPGPPPLPPASIFAAAAPTLPAGLPTFNELVPPDAAALGPRLQSARDATTAEDQDMRDALDMLQALIGGSRVN